MILLKCCWIHFTSILFRIFVSVFTRVYWTVVFSPYSIVVGFWYQNNAGFIECIWKCFSPFFSRNIWGASLILLSMCSKIYQWSHLVVGFALLGGVWLLAIGLFRFPISLWLSLSRLRVSRSVSIAPRLPSLLVYKSQ